MVTVVGLGFVGLTTALGLCEFGNMVYGIDANEERMQLINGGKIPFSEPGLSEALIKYKDNKFFPTTEWTEAIKNSDIVFYCVGTPYGENGEADLTYLFRAIDQTIDAINDDKHRTLVIKSTVPPTTASDKVVPYIAEHHANKAELISVANNPEFLREGHCWDDFINADRIVIGSDSENAIQEINKLYQQSGAPVYNVSLNTAEFIKYLSNTSLATMISYANEMSIVADKIGDIDIAKSFRILHQDKRWQTGSIRNYMYPGCGYGGYCLPKDTNAFYALSEQVNCDAKILGEAIKLNDNMPSITAKRIANHCKDDKETIGILGLSFNVGSDDVRDTPVAKIIKELYKMGYTKIIAYDPMANETFVKAYPEIKMEICDSCQEVIDRANVIAIVTAWNEFKNIKSLTNKEIIDCRYML